MDMGRWSGEWRATGGVVRFLSLDDLWRLRRVSKGACKLVDAWLQLATISLRQHRILGFPINGKGASVAENWKFLDSLDFALSYGARVSVLGLCKYGEQSTEQRRFIDRLAARIAVVGHADGSLKELFVEDWMHASRPCFAALPCFTGLRSLRMEIKPDASSPVFPRRCLLAAFKRCPLRELHFCPEVYGLTACDMGEIPIRVAVLELDVVTESGRKLMEAWLSLSQPRLACANLTLNSRDSEPRRLSLEGLDAVFPNLHGLSFRASFASVDLLPSRGNVRFNFPELRGLELYISDYEIELSHMAPPDLDMDETTATGVALRAFSEAFASCDRLRFQ